MRLVNRTEIQLKFWRFIRNKIVADSIVNYWSMEESLYKTFDNVENHRIKAKDLSFLLFNGKYYGASKSLGDVKLIGEPVLMTKAPEILIQFANLLYT